MLWTSLALVPIAERTEDAKGFPWFRYIVLYAGGVIIWVMWLVCSAVFTVSRHRFVPLYEMIKLSSTQSMEVKHHFCAYGGRRCNITTAVEGFAWAAFCLLSVIMLIFIIHILDIEPLIRLRMERARIARADKKASRRRRREADIEKITHAYYSDHEVETSTASFYSQGSFDFSDTGRLLTRSSDGTFYAPSTISQLERAYIPAR